jgi:micrococcal nuclease
MSLGRKNLLIIISVLLFFKGISGCFTGRSVYHKQDKRTVPPQYGLVTAVYDGDTLKVKFKDGSERKVRLIGVDAPEINEKQEDALFRALMAKRFVFFYLYRENIKLTYDWDLEDNYGRILAYVWTEGEGLFNKFIISEGFASVFQYFPFRCRDEFVEAEQKARKLEKGLWRKGDYPSILPGEAGMHVGELLTVKYLCVQVEAKGKFVFLHSKRNEFSTLIPQESLNLFPGIQSCMGKVLSVTGFLEEYKGSPQIVAFLPIQIIKGMQ